MSGGQPSSTIAASRSQRHCVIGLMLSSARTTRSGTKVSLATISAVATVFGLVTVVTRGIGLGNPLYKPTYDAEPGVILSLGFACSGFLLS